MLHITSYDLGKSAGVACKAAGISRPDSMAKVPGIEAMMEATENRFFFPSSYAEGFLAAYDYPAVIFAESTLPTLEAVRNG